MSEPMITCPHCGQAFAINKAIEQQMAAQLAVAKSQSEVALRRQYEEKSRAAAKAAADHAAAAARAETEALLAAQREAAGMELAKIRAANESALNAARRQNESETLRLKEAAAAAAAAKETAALALAKARQETEFAVQKARRENELETARLQQEAAAAREHEERLRADQLQLIAELTAARKAGQEAQLKAEHELLAKEKLIRAAAAEQAAADFNTKIREQEETINRLREQAIAAKQVAEQGSQQSQGEILELDLEQALHNNFPQDGIDEVKKGERGADIRQAVRDRLQQHCGLILWECKNAKTYQNSWLTKLKDELVTEKAQMGVIVFNSPDPAAVGYSQLDDNIWLVPFRHALMLATLLRQILVKVAVANRNAEGKDVKIELIYQYLTGGEFNNRIRYLIDSYDELTRQLELEKKQAQKRWAAQEKIIQKVTGSLYGMSGDLEGITGKEIIALPGHDTEEEEQAPAEQLRKPRTAAVTASAELFADDIPF